MSQISNLGPKFANLPALLAQYEDELADNQKILETKGKQLSEALKEQTGWPIYYRERYVELKTLCSYFESEIKRVRGEAAEKVNGGSGYSRNATELNLYLDQHPDVVKVTRLSFELIEIRDKYAQVVDEFSNRGHALRHFTNARIAEIHNYEM